MITGEQALLDALAANGLSFVRVLHPPVFTCAEAELHRPPMPATSTKNLLLADKKGSPFFSGGDRM